MSIPQTLRAAPPEQLPRRVRRAANRRPGSRVLAARGQLRHLRNDHQRADRHPLHPRRQRPRHADHRRGRACSPPSASSTSRARCSPAGSPTASTRSCCSSSTTRAAASRCCCCRRYSRRTRNRAPGCSSSSTGWTGWPPCRRRSCSAATTSARAPRWCSAGCSPRTNSVRPSPQRAPGGCATCNGDYDLAFYLAAGLCGVAALLVSATCEMLSQGRYRPHLRLWARSLRFGGWPCAPLTISGAPRRGCGREEQIALASSPIQE